MRAILLACAGLGDGKLFVCWRSDATASNALNAAPDMGLKSIISNLCGRILRWLTTSTIFKLCAGAVTRERRGLRSAWALKTLRVKRGKQLLQSCSGINLKG